MSARYRPSRVFRVPYRPTADPAVLGLSAGALRTPFGRLAFVRSSRTGPNVTLFLHGVGGNWATWAPLLRAARDLDLDLGDVLLVDLPGFGKSENVLSTLRAEIVGSVLRGVVGDLGWKTIRLVGHSMGGFLALDMASRGLPGVLEVSVVSGAYFSIVDTIQAPFRTLRRRSNTAVAYTALTVMARLRSSVVTSLKQVSDAGCALAPCAHKHLAATAASSSFLLAAQNGKHYDAARQWSQISIPVRAVFGADDRLVPRADMDRLQLTVPAAECLCLDHVGHHGHRQRPASVVKFFFQASAGAARL
jgi:pimeloyl-ACP methyl ester carboxylesterase